MQLQRVFWKTAHIFVLLQVQILVTLDIHCDVGSSYVFATPFLDKITFMNSHEFNLVQCIYVVRSLCTYLCIPST